MSKGLYIVFEGMSGCGKTTQARLLHDVLSKKFSDEQIIYTYEPGGSEIASAIRVLVQGTEFNEKMDPLCEAYLYSSSRAQTLSTIVKPHLENNGVVISDRSFVTSLAFQGYTRGLGFNKILEINQSVLEIAFPSLVIYLDIEPSVGLNRMFDHKGDKFENEAIEFYQNVRKGYLEISKLEIFKDRWLTINVNDQTIENIHKIIMDNILPLTHEISLSKTSNLETNPQMHFPSIEI